MSLVKQQKDKPKSTRIFFGRKFIGLLLVGAMIGGLMAASHMAIQFASQMVEAGARNAAAGLVLFSQYSLIAVEGALVNGTDDQRIEVLTEIAKADFSASDNFPESILVAIQDNLEHENELVRESAAAALESLNPDSDPSSPD